MITLTLPAIAVNGSSVTIKGFSGNIILRRPLGGRRSIQVVPIPVRRWSAIEYLPLLSPLHLPVRNRAFCAYAKGNRDGFKVSMSVRLGAGNLALLAVREDGKTVLVNAFENVGEVIEPDPRWRFSVSRPMERINLHGDYSEILFAALWLEGVARNV